LKAQQNSEKTRLVSGLKIHFSFIRLLDSGIFETEKIPPFIPKSFTESNLIKFVTKLTFHSLDSSRLAQI